MNTIISKLLTKMTLGHDTVLVTIVSETGSTPRGTGAQMLVGYNGWLAGTIGGGAVEKKAIEYGRELVVEKRSVLHEYQLRTESSDNLDMACGGDVRVLPVCCRRRCCMAGRGRKHAGADESGSGWLAGSAAGRQCAHAAG